MPLRVPMLLLLSGTFAGGVASTYVVPKLLASSQPGEAQTVASANAAEPKTAAKPEAAETVAAQPAKEASAAAGCKAPAWPYIGCTGQDSAAAEKAERQVRVISTDRDAPSRVPLPAPVTAQLPAPAIAQVPAPVTAQAEPEPEPAKAPVQVASVPEAAPAPNLPAQAPVAENEGEGAKGEDAKPSPVAARPPQKPVLASAGQGSKAKAEEAPSALEPADTAPSARPAPQRTAKLRRPVRRDYARAERPGRDMSERIRQARRNFDDGDTVVQTTTYQYADGHQLVFRSEPRRMERRRWLAEEPMERVPRMEMQPARLPRDPVMGWLSHFGF